MGGDNLEKLHAWRKLHGVAKQLVNKDILDFDIQIIGWPKKGSSKSAGQADFTALNAWLTDKYQLGGDEENEENGGSANPEPPEAPQGKKAKGNTEMHDWIIPLIVKLSEKQFMVYDYLKNKYTALTPTIILAAKKDLSSWLGTIEAGCFVAAAVLENRVTTAQNPSVFSDLPTDTSCNPGSQMEVYLLW
jgi:hypothetical protein